MYDVSENTTTTPANIVKLLSGISFVHSYNTLVSTSEHFHTIRLNDKRNAFLTCWGQNLEQDTSNSLKKKKALKRRLQY